MLFCHLSGMLKYKMKCSIKLILGEWWWDCIFIQYVNFVFLPILELFLGKNILVLNIGDADKHHWKLVVFEAIRLTFINSPSMTFYSSLKNTLRTIGIGWSISL